jgi:hypothetical protein
VKSLAELFKKRLFESNRRFRQRLMTRVDSLRSSGLAYAADVDRYFNKLQKSEAREDYWIPLDLWSVNRAASAVQQLRQDLTEFGQLLHIWPGIFEAAKSLRRDGVRVSVAV